MPSYAASELWPGQGPTSCAQAAAGEAVAWLQPIATLSRLATELVASSPDELAEAWLADATQRLPVQALHLALNEGDKAHLWASHAPTVTPCREIEQTIETGMPSRTLLQDGTGVPLVRLTVPVSAGDGPIGALAADVTPTAEVSASAALEALRWPLGLRLAGLMGRTMPPYSAASVAARRLWSQMLRCNTLTELLCLLVSALPPLLDVEWAAVATCDPRGRLLHITSLETGCPLDLEAWARAVDACAAEEGSSRPVAIPSATGEATVRAWARPLHVARSPLRYILAVGGRRERLEGAAAALLAEAAAHAEENLGRVLVVGEMHLALEAQERAERVVQTVTSLSQDARPDQALAAAMDAVLREVPGAGGCALHLFAGEELVYEQSVGMLPADLCQGAGLGWWQARLTACTAARRAICARLPQPVDGDTMLVTMPIMAGEAEGKAAGTLGVVSLFASSPEAVDLALRAALPPFAHIIAPLVQNLQRHRALERASRELEQRRAQVIQSKSALEAILDGFPDGLFVVDRDLRVTLSNDVQMRRVHGAEQPSSGQYCWELYGSGDGICPGCRIMDTLRKGISTRRRMRVRRPDQPEREWEVATHPIARRSARSSQAALVIVRDVTEQEQIAKSLARVEKLAAVGRLAAGIAHEINNPLAAILANVQLLLDGTSPNDDRFESLEIVRRSAERARRVVWNLLSFSEQSADPPTAVDVNASIRAALNLVSHQAKQRGVAVRCRLADELPAVMAGADQLESVWLNLALNALDRVLGEDGLGRIEVTSEVAPGGQVRVVVRDNGPSIAVERLPHLFEPFGGSPAPTVGTGLGLFSCHQTAKRLGGTIRAWAPEGGGTAFEVLLPALAAGGDPPETSAADGLPVAAT